jgi:hypothetical protein
MGAPFFKRKNVMWGRNPFLEKYTGCGSKFQSIFVIMDA